MNSGNKVVAIYALHDDAHADLVQGHLLATGVGVFRLNAGDMLRGGAAIEVMAGADGVDGVLIGVDGRHVTFDGIGAHYYRRWLPPEAASEVTDTAARRVAQDDAYSLFRQYCASREGRSYWMSHPLAIRRAEHKLLQLRVAAELGFRIPSTIITQSAATARAFAEHHGAIALKSISGVIIEDDDGAIHSLLTRRLTRNDLTEEVLRGLKWSPVLLQAYVEKRVEYRVTVVGNEVFAIEIDSQKCSEAREDWRRPGARTSPHRLVDLPIETADRCRMLVAAFGLQFGAIDLIGALDGGHVFVELNANGQWGWCQDLTGAPIAEAIAGRLAAATTI